MDHWQRRQKMSVADEQTRFDKLTKGLTRARWRRTMGRILGEKPGPVCSREQVESMRRLSGLETNTQTGINRQTGSTGRRVKKKVGKGGKRFILTHKMC